MTADLYLIVQCPHCQKTTKARPNTRYEQRCSKCYLLFLVDGDGNVTKCLGDC